MTVIITALHIIEAVIAKYFVLKTDISETMGPANRNRATIKLIPN